MYHVMLEKTGLLILRARKEIGIPVGLFSGTRTFTQQKVEWLKGRNAAGNIVDEKKVVTRARPGMSWHNYGLASDVVFIVDGKWNWSGDLPWGKLGVIGKEVGLEWGGDFPGDFQDRPHFQLTGGVPIEEALSVYEKNGQNVVAVWEYIAPYLGAV